VAGPAAGVEVTESRSPARRRPRLAGATVGS